MTDSQLIRPTTRWARGARRALALALAALAAEPSEAQSLVAREKGATVLPHVTPVVGRMAVGERARYEMRLGGRGVGTGSLEILGEERIDGHPALHAVLQVSGGVLFAKVNDRFESWIDPHRIFSRRFVQDQHELTRKRYRDYRMSPETKTFRQHDSADQETLGSSEPLDDVSFLFHARTLPLRVGDVDTIPRYFKPGRDVIIRVLRKERITVPAGTFETIVVQPTITNVGGLFGQGGQAELYFTDDAARTLVQLKSKVPVVGSLSLHLTEFRAGR